MASGPSSVAGVGASQSLALTACTHSNTPLHHSAPRNARSVRHARSSTGSRTRWPPPRIPGHAPVSSGHGILRIPRYPGDTVSSGYHWHPGDTAASSGCHWCPADSRISLRTCTYIGVITSGEKSACIKEIGRHHGFRPNKSGVPCFLTPTCKLRHMESTRRSWRNSRVTGKVEVSVRSK